MKGNLMIISKWMLKSEAVWKSISNRYPSLPSIDMEYLYFQIIIIIEPTKPSSYIGTQLTEIGVTGSKVYMNFRIFL